MTTPARAATPAARRRLSGRLILGAAAAGLVAVPFTLIAAAVREKSTTLTQGDISVANALHAQVLPRPWLEDTLGVLSIVTHPNTLRVIAAGVAVVLWRRGRRRLVAWLAVTMTVSGLLSPLLKDLFARARPVFADPVTTADGYSFPSGHAQNSMTFAACLLVLGHPALRGARRVALWVFAVVLVLVTGLDRVMLGVHYVSDVVGGWVLGLATVLATTAAFATWRRREGLPAPSLEEGLDPEDADRPDDVARRARRRPRHTMDTGPRQD